MAQFSVRITTAAKKDLRTLRIHSRRLWGESATEEYVNGITAAVASLGTFPERGSYVDWDDRSIRHVPTGRHVIYYRTLESQSTVQILRVLHERMAVAAEIE
jgi:toxin ParE1/3/4